MIQRIIVEMNEEKLLYLITDLLCLESNDSWNHHTMNETVIIRYKNKNNSMSNSKERQQEIYEWLKRRIKK